MMKAVQLALVLLCLAVYGARGEEPDGMVSRGKYLTEEVARCQDCHTRRLATGQLDLDAWLRGGTVEGQAKKASGKAGIEAPDITPRGQLWARWGEKGMLRFLETGSHPGTGVRKGVFKGMPPFKLRSHDAEAIMAYLSSLR